MVFKEYDYDNQPIVEIVNEIMADAVKNRASDIHFDPTPDKLKVRFRIDGDLVDYAYVPNAFKKNMTTRIKIISGMNIYLHFHKPYFLCQSMNLHYQYFLI